jgi:hypothetical protein
MGFLQYRPGGCDYPGMGRSDQSAGWWLKLVLDLLEFVPDLIGYLIQHW